MTEEQSIRQLRDELAQVTLAPAARERITRRVEEHTQAAGERAVARSNRRRLPRAPRIALGAVCAVAAGIALVVALGPGSDGDVDGGSGVGRFVGPDTAVARELVRAGDRAATQQWGPLGDGEYYHLYSTSVPGDTGGWGVPTSSELWMDQQGRGQMLTVTGTNDPDRLPDPRGGSFWTGEPPRPISIEESLTKANSANLITFPGPDEPGIQRTWTRNATGFHMTYDSETSRLDDGGTPDWKPEQTMRMYWSITTERIEALPDEGGPAMDEAIEELLTVHLDESPWRTNRVPTGLFGMTQEQVDREERIRYAVNLLGTAPLPPEARRSLYRWLARQPGAKLERDVKDAIGRPGSRITFESVYDEQVPAERVTAGELLDRATAGGAELDADAPLELMHMVQRAPGIGGPREQRIGRAHAFAIDAHREQRTWRITIVIDPDTGELLQQQLAMQKRASAEIPELMRHEDTLQIAFTGGRGSTEQEGGSGLYLARGIARIDQARSPVCEVEPKVCRE